MIKKYYYLFLSCYLLPGLVLAEVPDFGLSATAQVAGIPTNTAHPLNMVARVINIFLSILGVVFLILILYSGWLWLSASGNEEKVSQAKKLMAAAVIGLSIVVASYALAQFIYTQLKIAAG